MPISVTSTSPAAAARVKPGQQPADQARARRDRARCPARPSGCCPSRRPAGGSCATAAAVGGNSRRRRHPSAGAHDGQRSREQTLARPLSPWLRHGTPPSYCARAGCRREPMSAQQRPASKGEEAKAWRTRLRPATSSRSSTRRRPRPRRSRPAAGSSRSCTTSRIRRSRTWPGRTWRSPGCGWTRSLGGRQRTRRLTGLSVIALPGGQPRRIELPEGKSVSVPAWAPDGRRFAFTRGRAGRDRRLGGRRRRPRRQPRCRACGSATCSAATRRRPGRPCAGPGTAARCSRSARPAPAGAPCPAAEPIEPQLEEAAGKRSQMATFTDLLRTDADADVFEALATTVPLRVDPDSGAATELGPPGLYYHLSESPGRRAPAGVPAAAAVLVPGAVPVLRPPGRGVVGRRRARAGHRRPAGQRRGAAAGRADRPADGVVGGVRAGQPGLDRGAGRRRSAGQGRAPGPALPAAGAVRRRRRSRACRSSTAASAGTTWQRRATCW